MILPASAGVIGWPVAHSKSPLIHRFWLAKKLSNFLAFIPRRKRAGSFLHDGNSSSYLSSQLC